jgi:integrase
MLLLAFRHGLRASELCGHDVEFASGTLHLGRAKGGQTSTHPLLGDELRALRALKRDAESPFIFVSERGAPFTVSGLQKLVERAGIAARCPSRCIRTCCAMPRATRWRTGPPTLGHCKRTWAIARSRARSDTPN